MSKLTHLVPLLALVLAAGALSACEAPIPGRDEIERDAAWQSGEWKEDFGRSWRVRINGRRVNATSENPSGLSLRGSISRGDLNFSMTGPDGSEIDKGSAILAGEGHAVFRMTGAGPHTGLDHGLWHFNHGPAEGGAVAPAPEATPSAGPSSAPRPAVTFLAPPTPTEAPSPTPTDISPSAEPTASPTPQQSGDPLDLRPPR